MGIVIHGEEEREGADTWLAVVLPREGIQVVNSGPWLGEDEVRWAVCRGTERLAERRTTEAETEGGGRRKSVRLCVFAS